MSAVTVKSAVKPTSKVSYCQPPALAVVLGVEAVQAAHLQRGGYFLAILYRGRQLMHQGEGLGAVLQGLAAYGKQLRFRPVTSSRKSDLPSHIRFRLSYRSASSGAGHPQG